MSDFSSAPIGSNLNGVGSVHRAALHGEPSRLSGVNESAGAASTADADRVELSSFAQHLAHLRQLPQVRHDRVDQVRSAVQSDDYVTEQKVDAAIDQWAREEL